MPDESVHCVVTSPPYWGLRAYKGDPGMIGLEPTFDEHLANLVAVFREVRRVLRKDGTLWLNYGDAYAANMKGTGGAGGRLGPTGVQTQGSNAGSFIDGGFALSHGLKPKDLMMMPARVAMALQADGVADQHAMRVIERVMQRLVDAYVDEPMPAKVAGELDRLWAEHAEAKGDSWWLRSEIVWHKPNPMPESVTDRPTNSHEKLFLLSRSAKYFYDAEAVRSGWAESTTERLKHSWTRTPRMGVPPGSQPDAGKSHGAGANLRNVWTIATHSFKEAHFATFPPALVEPCIKAGTSEKGVCGECGAPWVRETESKTRFESGSGKAGNTPAGKYAGTEQAESGTYDIRMGPVKETRTVGWSPTCDHDAPTVPATVLDPFGGSGTVGLVADRLQRSAILIEINGEYAEMARRRIVGDAPLLMVEKTSEPALLAEDGE